MTDPLPRCSIKSHAWKMWKSLRLKWEILRAPPLPWEWLEINDAAYDGTTSRGRAARTVNGWIPRWVAEKCGLDCKEFDKPEGKRGHTWIRQDISETLRRNYWWRTPEQFERDR